MTDTTRETLIGRLFTEANKADDVHADLMREAADVLAAAPEQAPAVQAEQPAEPTEGNWIAADDYHRNVRALDVALNGEEGAAQRPSLVDVLAQVQGEVRRRGHPLLAGPRGQAEDAQRLDAERWRYVRDHWSNVQFRYNRDPANSLNSLTLTIKADHYTGGNAEYIERDIDAARASDARKGEAS